MRTVGWRRRRCWRRHGCNPSLAAPYEHLAPSLRDGEGIGVADGWKMRKRADGGDAAAARASDVSRPQHLMREQTATAVAMKEVGQQVGPARSHTASTSP
jgi:hypothetical protein